MKLFFPVVKTVIVLAYVFSVCLLAISLYQNSLPVVILAAVCLLALDYLWRRTSRAQREYRNNLQFAMNIARYAGVDFGSEDQTVTRVRCVVCRSWVPLDEATLSLDEPPHFICQECVE